MYYEKEEDRNRFSIVPLESATREEAIAKAREHEEKTFGVVETRGGGWGVRVLSTSYEEVAKLLRPEDFWKVTGVTYEISGLPRGMCSAALEEFLAPEITVTQFKGTQRTGWGEAERRSFLIKTDTNIIWTRKQLGPFLATCKVSVPAKATSKNQAPSGCWGAASPQAEPFPSLHLL